VYKDNAQIKIPFSNLLNIISRYKTAFLVGTIIPSIIGIFLAEFIMAAQFDALQPILAGMTLFIVEILGVFLVDFPMSVLAGCIISRKTGLSESKYGNLAGTSFLTVFIIIVGLMGILHNFTTVFDVFGLGNAVILAAQAAFQQFGVKLVVMIVMLLIFDYFLCMLGGTLGFNILNLVYPSNYKKS
jgi:hypothetical protein